MLTKTPCGFTTRTWNPFRSRALLARRTFPRAQPNKPYTQPNPPRSAGSIPAPRSSCAGIVQWQNTCLNNGFFTRARTFFQRAARTRRTRVPRFLSRPADQAIHANKSNRATQVRILSAAPSMQRSSSGPGRSATKTQPRLFHSGARNFPRRCACRAAPFAHPASRQRELRATRRRRCRIAIAL